MPASRLPWPLSLQWPLRRSVRSVASFIEPSATVAGRPTAAAPCSGATAIAAIAAVGTSTSTSATAAVIPAARGRADAAASPAACFTGLRITRAVQPSRSLAARVPAIIRRSPCRFPEAAFAPGQTATLRRDPQDPQRVRISGRLADVCDTLERLVARHEGSMAA